MVAGRISQVVVLDSNDWELPWADSVLVVLQRWSFEQVWLYCIVHVVFLCEYRWHCTLVLYFS